MTNVHDDIFCAEFIEKCPHYIIKTLHQTQMFR